MKWHKSVLKIVMLSIELSAQLKFKLKNHKTSVVNIYRGR